MRNDKIKAIGNGKNANTGEVVLYQPDNTTQLQVQIKNETVWLTQKLMATLFDCSTDNVSLHLKNIFKENELEENSVVEDFSVTASDGKNYKTKHYNLDAIIAIGYRVNSKRATSFRKWATQTLKEYILRGYAINPRIERFEYRMTETENKIDFFVRSALPPKEGILFDGQIFDAYVFVSDLVRSAKKSIVLIDNYIDESVLLLLSKRLLSVGAVVYTSQISKQLQLDIQRYNAQYPPVELRKFTKSHDRFLIIDDTVYHIGASLKDLGKKWFAFNKMELGADILLDAIEQSQP
jgi:hypothetical protein